LTSALLVVPELPVAANFFFSSRRRHTRFSRDWSSDVCSSDLVLVILVGLYSVLFHWIMATEGRDHSWATGVYWTLTVMSTLGFRSEERRVGKECRWPGSQYSSIKT